MSNINRLANKTDLRNISSERPMEHNQMDLHSCGVIKRFAISNELLTGLFLPQGDHTGENYRKILVNYAFPRSPPLREAIFHSTSCCLSTYF